uniref:ATPase subunit 6 n=1 Tax=Tetrancistrum nebulosi TaxID=879209 RepID=I3NLS4_9PLAT|nr:ATP synthase F0 subunit 6 [Tetrancistrum nebulosi]ADN44067.1 ATPase subunit 6 [Tetrancistrum nebulosi]
MFIINRFNSFSCLVKPLVSNLGSLYKSVCLTLLVCFLYLRTPFLYGVSGLLLYIFILLAPMFVSLFVGRLENGVNTFFSSLLPPGTPLWIAPLVGFAETISYIVRPIVLMLRPFLNITIGCFAALAIGGGFCNNWLLIVGLLMLFFYEIFVAMVHWFIVVNILDFSIDH